jgi:hypothetical protein
MIVFRCPFCNQRTSVDNFIDHCWNNHPDVSLPEKVDLNYLERRFAPVGGLIIEGFTNNPEVLMESK